MRPYQELFLAREELYERIWKEPMRKVAAQLGISDVGLKKLCNRNGIPTPPQGYHLMTPGPAKNRLVKPLPPPAPKASFCDYGFPFFA
jgi:hypothetical protein